MLKWRTTPHKPKPVPVLHTPATQSPMRGRGAIASKRGRRANTSIGTGAPRRISLLFLEKTIKFGYNFLLL
jgi:hypothetical protein